MNIDYIIIGGGYAGLFFAHQLIKNNKTFILFTERDASASEVSAGMINPAVLKKFTTFWLAQEQIDFLHHTLLEVKSYTQKDYFINQHVHRIFHDKQERALWLNKANNDNLKPFLSTDTKSFKTVVNPFGVGEVLQSGRLDVKSFFNDIFAYLEEQRAVRFEAFKYEDLEVANKIYQDLCFSKIVFCEGIHVKNNPFFSNINIQPNKGHHLVVRLSKPLLDEATFKKKHFLFHLKEDLFYYGGTYDRIHTDNEIDEHAIEQLENGLREFYPHDFEIVDVEYGFRPTVKDRRPIMGKHAKLDDYFVFNGLGARGILNGCYFAKDLFDFIETAKPLHPEVDINRF